LFSEHVGLVGDPEKVLTWILILERSLSFGELCFALDEVVHIDVKCVYRKTTDIMRKNIIN
jgi:hypothetical protein